MEEQYHTHPASDPLPTDSLAATLRTLALNLVGAASDIYAGIVVVYLLLRLTTGDHFWPVALAGTFIHWLLLPGFVFALLMLVLRHWKHLAISLIPVGAYLWLFGGLLMPVTRPQPVCAAEVNGCVHLRVMAYNLGSVYPGQPIADAVAQADADVVGLLEVVDEQVAVLDQALADEYPYRVFYPQVIHGKALLSRYPILELEGPFHIATHNTHLRAVLDVDGHPLTVIVAHPPRPVYRLNLGYVYPAGTPGDWAGLAELGSSGDPTVIMGDFNNTDQSDNYRIMVRAGMTDAYRATGHGLGTTFPARDWLLPPTRIDFVWTSSHITPLSAWVGPDGGSDHLPIVADLVWPVE